jgi:hypothetical protein
VHAEFARFLHRDEWQAPTLAGFLGVTEDQAEAILGLFGFAYDDQRSVWRRAGDDAARLLEETYREAAWYGGTIRESAEALASFEARIREMVETGEPPAERADDEPHDVAARDDFLELVSFTVTPEGFVAHGRIGVRELQVQVPAVTLDEGAAGQFVEIVAAAYGLFARELERAGTDARQALPD